MSRSPLVRLATAIAGAAVAVGSAPLAAADTVTGPAPDPGASTVVAGTGEPGATGDGGDATEAQVENAAGVAVDGDGAVYIADADDHRVRRVGPDGTISTFAGNGEEGNSGDGGAAGDARLSDPGDVAVDSDGVVYIADTGNNRIRRVSPNGTIETLTGSAQEQQTSGVGDNGPATQAAVLHRPRAVAADPTGNVYIGQANRVSMVDQSGTISTVAGNAAATGSEGLDTFSGEDGPADEAAFTGLNGIDVAGDGTLAIVTEDRLLQVDNDGVITTLSEAADTSGDAGLIFGDNGDVALDSDGTPYLVGGDAGAVRVDPQDGDMAVVGAGQALGAAVGGDDNLYTAAGAHVMMLGQPAAPRAPARSGEATVGEDDAAVPAGGDDAPSDEDPGTITTAVTAGGDGDDLALGERPGLSVDTTGHLYVSGDGPTVRVVGPDGAASPFAGGSISRFGGDAADEELAEAQIHDVTAVSDDGLCLATSAGVVTAHPDGTAVPVAGDDPSSRDDTPSDPPLTESPYELQAVGGDGTVYLAERGGARVHAVDQEGAFRVVAGTGEAGLSGDGGPAVDAEFDSVSAIAVGPDDTLYVADSNNDRIRRVDSEGAVTTVVDAADADAPLRPSDLAVDAHGILYISDADSNRVYRAAPDGAVNAIAGGGSAGSSGDGGPALDAELAGPGGLALDGAGNLYVADSGNDRIRVIAAASDAPTENVGVSAGVFPWAPVLWSALGVVVLGLGALVLWRPGEVAISVVAWGIAGYTLLRERIDRIRGRGGARRPNASAQRGGAAETESESGHDGTP